jgi:hypothetical protein
MINTYIYIRKKRGGHQQPTSFSNNKKKLFDMVKVTNSSPIFKQSRAKNVFFALYQLVINIGLTAMPIRG